MERLALLLLGILAWLGVAITAVLVVNAWQDENQILAFLPIAAAVVVAWVIGEYVTENVFEKDEKGVRRGGA
jgi:high-affinity Fe2+/Pb2+ permease